MADRSLVNAVESLNPQPRQQRWRSLSYCVLDAVWSISALYDEVVVPLIWRVAAVGGDSMPLVSVSDQLPPDPLPLPALLEEYPDPGPLQHVTNLQRTSPRGGILKADAALRYARALADHGVVNLEHAQQLLTEEANWLLVDTALAAIPGDGHDGVRRGYLWMLVGDNDLIKPDRMVLRWLARQGLRANATKARDVIKEIAQALTERLGRPVTPWMVDHAIWQAERSRRKLQ
jgi:hypothetical protein